MYERLCTEIGMADDPSEADTIKCWFKVQGKIARHKAYHN